jgi:hypothetical protein
MRASSDLSATVSQSSADKLIKSVAYPFTVFDQSWPFQGRVVSGAEADYEYTQAEIKKMLGAAQKRSPQQTLPAPNDSPEDQVSGDIVAAASTVIESAKACLNARDEAEKAGKPFVGPSRALVQGILDGGVAGLASIRGIQIKAHLAWLKVVVTNQPNLSLGVPTIAMSNVNVLVSATGELWWYHPSFHCSHWCFNWSVTWGWDRIASLTINGVKLAIAAHANVSAQGTLIIASGVIDRLRLDYPILRDIPLEGFANSALSGKLVYVFDAGQYLATVPVLNSHFAVADITLPASASQIEVDITIKQV